MPVKLRKRKIRTAQITDEAREIYKDALKLQGIRWDCIRSVACRESSVGKHCPECLKYMDLSRELDRLLGIRPWQRSPLNADSEAPPILA